MFKFNKDILISGDENFYDVWEDYYNGKGETIAALDKVTIIGEIGVRAGYGASMFLNSCQNNNPEYVGFDSFDTKHHKGITNAALKEHSNELLAAYGYDYEIHTVNTQKVTTLKEYFPEGADFFHIDGDHSHKGALHDMELALEVLNPGGYILIDDVGEIQPNGKVLPIGTDIVRAAATEFTEKYAGRIDRVEEIKSLTGEWLVCLK